MNRSLALFVILAAHLPAQDQASTLVRLSDQSATVARVRAIAVTDPDQLQHRVVFATEENFKGDTPAVFALTEPAGLGCGRALHGILPGTTFVAFLVPDGNAMRLTHSGARSLPVAGAGLEAHLRALLETNDREDRVSLLCAALSAGNRRVRRDAALALPTLPELEGADAAARARILAALPVLLEQGEPAAAELLVAVSRLRLEGSLDILVPRYLTGRVADLAPLMRETITGLGAAAVHVIAASVAADPSLQEPAVDLLAGLAAPDARRALLDMLPRAPRAVRVRAAAALLSSGVPVADLRGVVGEQVVREAQSRQAAPPRYRSIFRRDRR